MMHNTAQGLASLGRGNDSMLMHVTPNEVAGLQSIAMAHGGSLTINPQTGLPEAGIFDAIGSVLPVAASMMFPTFAPGFIAPGVAAGALTGAAIAALSGNDPLVGGLTGGFGGYSGAKLAKGFTAAGTPVAATEAAKNTAASTVGGAAEQVMGGSMAGNVSPLGGIAPNFNPNNIVSSFNLADDAVVAAGQKFPNYSPISPGAGTVNSSVLPPLQEPINFAAAPDFSTIPGAVQGTGGYTTSLDIGQNMSDIGSGIKNTLGLGEIPQADAWKAATEAVPDMGATLALTGATTGLAALAPSGKLSKPKEDKYDPYASLNLSGDTGLRFYATGGDVYANQSSIASGGLQSLYGTSDSSGSRQPLSQDGYGIGRLGTLTAEGSRAKAADTFYAGGGAVAFDKGGETSLNLATHPSLNLNLANKPDDFEMISELYKGSDPLGFMGTSGFMGRMGQLGGMNLQNPDPLGFLGMSGLMRTNAASPRTPTSYALNLNSGKQEPQYAQGGYLNGAGDGMSDSIPATIEGKQPARLADGEFVVPADVVSHLGNGSSKAGSKRLYAMLDKVRHARTGNKKQGKQIKADKYLPA